MNVREATKNDLPDILRLVHTLAVYEKEPDAVEATEDDFAAVMFPDNGHPNTYGLVTEAAVPAKPSWDGWLSTVRSGA